MFLCHRLPPLRQFPSLLSSFRRDRGQLQLTTARVGGRACPLSFFSASAYLGESKHRMKPPGLRLAERAAPPGQWFRASVSDPKLGIITVRSAPARPVSWPAQPARLAGRSIAYPHWRPRSRTAPIAAQLARGSGGWAPQRLHGSGGRQRQSTALQQRTSGGQLTYRPATTTARRPIPVCQALARAKISKAGSFLPKSEWRHASTRAPKGHPRPPRPREAEPWTAAEAQPARQATGDGLPLVPCAGTSAGRQAHLPGPPGPQSMVAGADAASGACCWRLGAGGSNIDLRQRRRRRG